jgi:hypothetical protein
MTPLPMRLVLPLGLLLGLSGCGYNVANSAGNTREGGYRWNSLYREDIQTVAVPIFTNMDFRRGVEFRLTEAVVKELAARTHYKVAPRERADTILEGQLTAVAVGTLDRDFHTNLPREQQLVLSVDFVWKDLRTGQILAQRRGMRQDAAFYPTLGEGEFAGSQDAVERLALAIVQELQADW